jgi:hypothetical protein
MILNYILIRHILTNSRKNSYTESCDWKNKGEKITMI